MKKPYLVTGLVMSLFIALLGYALRLNRENIGASLFSFTTSFVNAFLSWLLVQYILQLKKPAGYGWKAIAAIAGCMLLSLLPIMITRHFAEVRSRIDAVPNGMNAISVLLLTRGLVIGGFLYFIAYLLRISELKRQSELENERLKQENLQARLSLLQEQVSPHFLFNSLGTLQSMVEEPAPREFIQRLSEVYRYLLSNRMADLVPLRSELDFTQAYLYILKERFEDALVTQINISENALQQQLPPASLQLLIENAVKHNVATTETPLTISIDTTEAGWLAVSNSLQKKSLVRNSLGSGLSNIMERYQLLAGLNIIIEETNTRFTVRIPLITKSQQHGYPDHRR
ncbi:histidine kinase [Chitinophaga sp. YIM B06452]|uniref:sensor histidine kinase n=1 Tax=Chitinophaga sp. YIM B06452 TaxID=3082158 RepID=UPI0031FEA734